RRVSRPAASAPPANAYGNAIPETAAVDRSRGRTAGRGQFLGEGCRARPPQRRNLPARAAALPRTPAPTVPGSPSAGSRALLFEVGVGFAVFTAERLHNPARGCAAHPGGGGAFRPVFTAERLHNKARGRAAHPGERSEAPQDNSHPPYPGGVVQSCA